MGEAQSTLLSGLRVNRKPSYIYPTFPGDRNSIIFILTGLDRLTPSHKIFDLKVRVPNMQVQV